MSARKPPEKIRFDFEKPDDYQIVYINGIYGGTTPRGDSLICHCYLEHPDTPAAEVGPVRNGVVASKDLTALPRGKAKAGELLIKRELKVGLAIPMSKVEEFANWMLEKVEHVKKLEKEQAKDPSKVDAIQFSV